MDYRQAQAKVNKVLHSKTMRSLYSVTYIPFEAAKEHKKWYFFGFAPEGNDSVACCYMVRSLIYLWLTYDVWQKVTTEKLRKLLFVTNVVNMLYGFVVLIIGGSHIRGKKSKLDPNPYSALANTHYVGVTIMGSLISLLSIFGFVGVYGAKMKVTKAFTVMAFLMAYLLLNVYITWLTQIYFAKLHLTTLSAEEKMSKDLMLRSINNLTFYKSVSEQDVAANDDQEKKHESYFYNLTYFFTHLVFGAAVLEITVGTLTLWMLILHNTKQGYIPLYYREEMEDIPMQPLYLPKFLKKPFNKSF